mgnify:CR=1 FL=1
MAKTAYYFPYALWASENGIANGTGYGFNPDGKITREQMAVMLYNYIADSRAMAKRIVDSWYNSIGHRRNMLHTSMDVAAVSCYVVDRNVYAAHLFSKHPLYFFDYDIYDIYGWPRT